VELWYQIHLEYYRQHLARQVRVDCHQLLDSEKEVYLLEFVTVVYVLRKFSSPRSTIEATIISSHVLQLR
jgi:hypothetical protein